MDNSTETLQEQNAELAFNYTRNTLERLDKGLDSLNSKLTTTLGASGILLRFAKDLSDSGLCFSLKVSVCIFVVFSALFCLAGLWPKNVGKHGEPSELIETDFFQDKNWHVKISITRKWIDGLPEIEMLWKHKARLLRWSYIYLTLASTCYAANIIADHYFK